MSCPDTSEVDFKRGAQSAPDINIGLSALAYLVCESQFEVKVTLFEESHCSHDAPSKPSTLKL